jgi:predicted phosphodiesterase
LYKNKVKLIAFSILVGLFFLFALDSISAKNDKLFEINKEKPLVEKFGIIQDAFAKEKLKQIVNSNDISDSNFALVGDWGCTKNTAKTVDLIQSQNLDLVFSLGDTSYKPTINCWEDIVNPISDKMKGIIGNHDVISLNLLKQHMEAFGLEKSFYSFDYHNNIHFLMMDSESSYLPGTKPDFTLLNETEQYQYVKDDLSQATKNPKIKWIIVMIHRQFYSSFCGLHDSCDPIKKLRDAYHPIFERYGVDLIFSGHAHNYQRTYPLFYNVINSSEPVIAEKNKIEYSSPNGMFQIIIGTGGIDLDPLSNQEPYMVFQQDSSYGFLNIDVTNQGNTLIGKYYTIDGDVLDEFKIIK